MPISERPWNEGHEWRDQWGQLWIRVTDRANGTVALVMTHDDAQHLVRAANALDGLVETLGHCSTHLESCAHERHRDGTLDGEFDTRRLLLRASAAVRHARGD